MQVKDVNTSIGVVGFKILLDFEKLTHNFFLMKYGIKNMPMNESD